MSESAVDEQRIAKSVSWGLPVVTVVVAIGVGVGFGPATAILVVAAGVLLGVIALLWASIRVLSGDAPLSPELEMLDMAAAGEDRLGARKKMLLRALKDLENEHAIGKIEKDDFEQVAHVYREDLKVVLKHIDDAIAPHRTAAEDALREHLASTGLGGAIPEAAASDEDVVAETPKKAKRQTCPKCEASNEPDAKFCKECATKLVGAAASTKTEATEEASDAE